MKYDIEKRFQNYMEHCFPNLNEKEDAGQIKDLRQIWYSCTFDVSAGIKCKLATVDELVVAAEKLCNEMLKKIMEEET